jgi:hypothetical protein
MDYPGGLGFYYAVMFTYTIKGTSYNTTGIPSVFLGGVDFIIGYFG